MRVVVDAVVQRCAKGTGSQRVDADAGACEFDAEAAGELGHRALTGCVACPACGTDQSQSAGQG